MAERTPKAARLGAAGLVVLSSFSAQLGAAYAFGLFNLTSPTMTAWIRNTVGASVLLLLVVARRSSLRSLSLRAAVAMGVVLGGMNATFYEGLQRLPLGDGVAIEFAGPIVVAALTASSRRHLVWVGLAAAGVLATSRPGPSHLNYVGMAFMLAAATFWGLYVLLGRRIATGGRRADTLALAMGISALFLTLPAFARSAPTLADPRVLALGALVGVLSSAIPYSVELMAMERVPPAIFGVLLSLQPLSAGLIGLVVLGQRVSLLELGGFCLVVSASLGVTFSAGHEQAPEGELLPT
ncbi:MAG: EamA family transporter [Candidatus Dormibacteraeota bacterium]|nr:EamA family transporter [Candidatus Dormibacteraeota bacterium]